MLKSLTLNLLEHVNRQTGALAKYIRQGSVDDSMRKGRPWKKIIAISQWSGNNIVEAGHATVDKCMSMEKGWDRII